MSIAKTVPVIGPVDPELLDDRLFLDPVNHELGNPDSVADGEAALHLGLMPTEQIFTAIAWGRLTRLTTCDDRQQIRVQRLALDGLAAAQRTRKRLDITGVFSHEIFLRHMFRQFRRTRSPVRTGRTQQSHHHRASQGNVSAFHHGLVLQSKRQLKLERTRGSDIPLSYNLPHEFPLPLWRCVPTLRAIWRWSSP